MEITFPGGKRVDAASVSTTLFSLMTGIITIVKGAAWRAPCGGIP